MSLKRYNSIYVTNPAVIISGSIIGLVTSLPFKGINCNGQKLRTTGNFLGPQTVAALINT